MSSTLIDAETLARLNEIAHRTGSSIPAIVAEAVLRSGYARLRSDPILWSAWTDELSLLNGASADGLS